MSKNRLFNIKIPLPIHPSLKDGGVTGPITSVGVINANQSVITFAGAPIVVTIIWKVTGLVFPIVLESYVLPVALSLIVGMLIYWQSAPTGATTKDKVLGFVFSLLNSFAIAAAVLGINSATNGTLPNPLG